MPSARTSTGARRSTGRQATPPSTRTHRVQRRTPIESPDGGTQIYTVTSGPRGTTRTTERRTGIPTGGSQFETTTESTPAQSSQARDRTRRNIREFSPTRSGEKAVAGVGLLEAEFIGSVVMLILLLFANSNASYADKIMSTIKRGSLLCFLFFILAMIAATGPNAAKIAKAFGGLVFVATMLTAPVGTAITDVDNLIKNDWVSTGEQGTDTAAGSSNAGTNVGGAALGGIAGSIESQLGATSEFAGQGYAIGRIAAAAATGNISALKNALASLGDKARSAAKDILGTFGIHF